MNKLLLALFLYLGVLFLFVVSSLSLVRGVSVVTATSRGVVALLIFAVLGVLASLVVRSAALKAQAAREKEGDGEHEDVQARTETEVTPTLAAAVPAVAGE